MALGAVRSEGRALAGRWSCSIDDAWVSIAALVPFVATALGATPAGDLAYQVRAGELMLRTHELLRTDVFTYTVAGRAWVNQQWAAAVLLGLLHGLGGWSAVALARAALDAVSFRLVYLTALRRSGDRGTSARLTIAGFVITAMFAGGLAARAQMFALPLFALAAALVADRRNHPARLWWLPVITAAWANLHGSFFLPALLLACAIAGDAIERHPVDASRLALLVACVLAAGVGPFGFGVYAYIASLRANPVVSHAVDEWRPIALVSASGAATYMSLAVIGFGLFRRRLSFTPAELLTLVVLSALALSTGRSVVWWGMGLPPLVAPALARVRAGGRARAQVGARAEPEARGEAPATALVGALVVLSMVAGLHAATVGRSFVTDAPQGITRFLADRIDPSERIFDAWWGSWFEYALPGRPMFVDARAELFPRRIWAQYFDIVGARPGWSADLDAWGVDVVVAWRERQTTLVEALRASAAWRQAYADADGFVFVRR